MMDTLLFYINGINGGGAARVIIQLARHFAEEGYKSILVTSFVDFNQEYEIPDNITRLSIEQEEIIQSRIKRNYSRIKKLRNICKREKPVAIISFMAEPNFRALIATTGLKTKRIISVRNDPNQEYSGRLGRIIGKLLLPQADGCVFQTEEAKAWFPKKLQEKSQVIANDVKEEFFNIQREDSVDIVAVGRLEKQKNHRLLINAFSKIANKYPNQKLRLYGDGTLEGDLRGLISDLNLHGQIEIMGATSHVSEVLKKAKMFVLSSDFEGMPNCLMEALAAGVPCISTDCPCGGPRMLIRDKRNGLLVPILDENALSDAMEELIRNPEYAETLGKNAKEEALQFHPDRIFAQWKAYIEEVIRK